MIRVGPAADLAVGESLTVEREEGPIAVFRGESGDLYATQDSCTHELWSLGTDGEVEGDEVVCPLHLARFDLGTGKPLCFPATVAMKTYDVEVDGEGIIWVSPDPRD
jgi:nitrite reductase/ring-hydroxylating ferredoxin subunit